jgi:thiamine biosynthesis lipoprotein
MQMNRRTLISGIFGATFAPRAALAGAVHSDGGFAFGSSWRVTIPHAVPLAPIRPRIAAIIADVDAQMSPYRVDSALSVFNASRTRDWQSMPSALCAVAEQALRVAAITGGAFDPTVGPLVSRYGFGPITGGLGGYAGLEAMPDALRKMDADLTLDLCGIAKGHALDRIAAALQGAGLRDALIEVGGEVAALGHHPDGRPWTVAIADPLTAGFAVRRIVAPGGMALATSGPAFNGLRKPLPLNHIIDPQSGRPASIALASVSVLAPTGAQADALATALCAAGPDAGPALARHLGLSALFVQERADDIMTGQFARHVMV